MSVYVLYKSDRLDIKDQFEELVAEINSRSGHDMRDIAEKIFDLGCYHQQLCTVVPTE